MRGAKLTSTVVIACACALAFTSSAFAQGPARQTASLKFTEQRTGVPTGAAVEIHYRDPANPEGKPPAVQRVVTALAPGTRIDTSVPARCGASDAAITREGSEACPPESIVGRGRVTLDTGIEGDRMLPADLTLLNNTGELIMLAELDNGDTRFVVRGRVSGSRIVTEVPPVPGGPPDGFTAIRDVSFRIARVSEREGRRLKGYVTTPVGCSKGSFPNSFEFTYRDGVTQEVASPSPCRLPDLRPPRIRIAGLPGRGCVEKGVRVRVRVRDRSRLRRVEIRLNGRRIKVSKRKRVVVRIRRSALRPRFNRLSVTARDTGRNRSRFVRRFFRCR